MFAPLYFGGQRTFLLPLFQGYACDFCFLLRYSELESFHLLQVLGLCALAFSMQVANRLFSNFLPSS